MYVILLLLKNIVQYGEYRGDWADKCRKGRHNAPNYSRVHQE